MLPFERIRPSLPASAAGGQTSPNRTRSPLRGGSPGNAAGTSAVSVDPNETHKGASLLLRPHSRPAAQTGQALMPRSRAVMLPSSPPKGGPRSGSPPLGASSPLNASRPGTQQATRVARPPGRGPASATASAPAEDSPARSGAAHSLDCYARTTGGVSVKDLACKEEVALNLKAYDLDRPLPMTDPACPAPPKFALAVSDGILDLDLAQSAGIGMTATSAVDDFGQPVSVLQVPGFCKFVVDGAEVGCDRSLQYHTFVEAEDMFAVKPRITPEGDLTCAVAGAFTGSGCYVWIRLADNAAITRDGEISTSEPIPVFFATAGRGLTKRQLPKAKDWHSFKNKATAPTAHVPPSQAPSASPATGARPVSPTRAVGALSTSHGGLNTSSASATAGPSGAAHGGDAEVAYSFPLLNIHTLREDGLDAEPLMRGELPPSSGEVRPLRIHGLLKPPLFASIVTDIERLRQVHLMLERDRLVGEAVPREQLDTVEARLKERLAADEASVGPMAAQHAPNLTRLAQLALMRGGRSVGDAVELFERVVRIRADVLGMQTPTDIRGLAAAVTQDPNDGFAKAEALVQALIVLATVLKHAARYDEGIEFARAAATVAHHALGKDHAAHIRALAQVGELLYLAGRFEDALKAYRDALELCDIIIGRSSNSATSVRHLIGACLSALERPSEAAAAHDEALALREEACRAANDAADAGEEDAGDGAAGQGKLAASAAQAAFQVAESLVFCARCAYLRNDIDAAHDCVQQAQAILDRYDVTSSAEYAVANAALASISAGIHLARGDGKSAIQVAHDAASAVCSTRGDDSIEFATASARLAIVTLKAFALDRQPELPAPLQANSAAKAIRARLKRATSILTSALGPQHPCTARAACILAQLDATEATDSAVLSAAREGAERALRALEQSLGPKHRDTGAAAEATAIVLMLQREDAAAASLLHSAVHVAKACMLGTRLQRLLTRVLIVHGRLRQPLPEEVMITAEEVYQRVRSALGEAALPCLEPLQNLAEAAYHAGEYERAHHFLTKALKVADANNMIFLLGPLFKPAAQLSTADVNERNRLAANRMDPTRAMSFSAVLFSIACVFEAQGRSQEAQSTLLQVLAALELSNHQVHIHTAETLRALGIMLYRDGFYGDALAYCEKAFNLLLEHHPGSRDFISLAYGAIDVIDKQLRASGYLLSRHSESRYRFAVFL